MNAEATDGRFARPLRLAAWAGAAGLFLVPVIAEQLSSEMAWSAFDFVFCAVMLVVAAGAFDLATRISTSLAQLAGFAIAIGTAFILIWINLAVGVIGSEDNPANLMFFGVLLIALISALVARFRPEGMAWALAATALAQASVGVIALGAGWGSTGDGWPQVIVVLTAFFTALWLASAGLFRAAALRRTREKAVA